MKLYSFWIAKSDQNWWRRESIEEWNTGFSYQKSILILRISRNFKKIPTIIRDVVAAKKKFIEKSSFPNSMNRMNTWISVVWCFVISIRWPYQRCRYFLSDINQKTFCRHRYDNFHLMHLLFSKKKKKLNKFQWQTSVRNAYTNFCQWTNVITNQPNSKTYNNRKTSSPTHTLEHFCCTVHATHGSTCIWEALESHIFFSILNNWKQCTEFIHTVWDRRRESKQMSESFRYIAGQ